MRRILFRRWFCHQILEMAYRLWPASKFHSLPLALFALALDMLEQNILQIYISTLSSLCIDMTDPDTVVRNWGLHHHSATTPTISGDDN